jgi:hypothetical protein
VLDLSVLHCFVHFIENKERVLREGQLPRAAIKTPVALQLSVVLEDGFAYFAVPLAFERCCQIFGVFLYDIKFLESFMTGTARTASRCFKWLCNF